MHQAKLESWLGRAAGRGRERLASLPLCSKVKGRRPLRSAEEEVVEQFSVPSLVRDLPMLKVKVLSEQVRRVATYLQEQLQQRVTRELKAWVSKAEAGGAGAAHRFSRSQLPPSQGEEKSRSQTMEVKGGLWWKLWGVKRERKNQVKLGPEGGCSKKGKRA